MLLRRLDALFAIPNTSPTLVFAQLSALKQQVPLLYLILIINAATLAYTHHGIAPASLAVAPVLALTTICSIRYRKAAQDDVARDVVTEKYILGMRIILLGCEHALRSIQDSGVIDDGFEYADEVRRIAARGAASTVLAFAENLPKIVDARRSRRPRTLNDSHRSHHPTSRRLRCRPSRPTVHGRPLQSIVGSVTAPAPRDRHPGT